ncbi:insoluble matrix shell protein 2-like [Ruditapes philippinarum]|uniref:insoluble matrix shell protein 2-like n=1 Tax=Ruditapes philippinarum TaxID=129788 RepID=UPI00295B7702|nr:insoluble matrix shell protein 2-like [Ruditapes philippinarum]
MKISGLNVLIFCGILSCFTCFRFDMNGWDALPLSSPKIDDSFKLATDHVGGRLTKKLTGFKRRDGVPEWDLYRVSFLTALPNGKGFECHADVLWAANPSNTTVYNLGC